MHAATPVENVCATTYLLQVDVFIDDSLVPLGVETFARGFGPPLVFSAGGTHHNKIHPVTEKPPEDSGPLQCNEHYILCTM